MSGGKKPHRPAVTVDGKPYAECRVLHSDAGTPGQDAGAQPAAQKPGARPGGRAQNTSRCPSGAAGADKN